MFLFNKDNSHYFRLQRVPPMTATPVQTREVNTSSVLVHDLALRLQTPADSHKRRRVESALSARIRASHRKTALQTKSKTPMMRMRECRNALALLDTTGWNRSFHQRQFHEDFLKACTRTFWKMEPPGSFARCHQQVLQENSWEHLAQEVLISTPRRFGKTISVSMFAAAMLYSAPAVELSIYSTCKRISQKLLRGVVKFFYEICGQDLGKHNFHIRRQNMEEIVLIGPEGERDVRIVNSYPSKVRAPALPLTLASSAHQPRARHAARTTRRAHNTPPPRPGRAARSSGRRVRLPPGARPTVRLCMCVLCVYYKSYSTSNTVATVAGSSVGVRSGSPTNGRRTVGAGCRCGLRKAALTPADNAVAGSKASSGVWAARGGVFIWRTRRMPCAQS